MNTVAEWLEQVGLPHLTSVFMDAEIELDLLHELTNEDLKDIGVERIADRKRLLQEIAKLTVKKAQTTVERRLLSVLFCDLVGSTALSVQLDPEELREALHVYQETAVKLFTKYGGFIASYLGDGVLAYFGWPYADEDQAAQAVRAGLEAVAAVRNLTFMNRQVPHCRVGIATGRVVVGGALHLDSAVGETPNLAARLQGLAAQDEVVIDEATHHAIGQRFTSIALDEADLKGFGHPVRAWRVTNERDYVDRFESRERPNSQFVGRDEELRSLRNCWQRAGNGVAQVVVIQGDAGIGKSRLVKELELQIQEERPTVIRFQCSAFHTNSAFYPAIRQFEKAAGFESHDEPASSKLRKLEELFAGSVSEFPNTLGVMADLLSISPADSSSVPQLSAAQRRGLVVKILVADAMRIARRNPLLLIVEDAHWIDPSSQELLEALVAQSRDAPVLTVVTTRPSKKLNWTEDLDATQVSLGRLDDRDIGTIARSIGSQQLSEADLKRIVSRVDGVPLFAEEITSNALEHRAAHSHTFDLPETIQASLAARLDLLGEAKDIAQIASVLGREFRSSQLSALTKLALPTVEAALRTLVTSGLVLPGDQTGEFTYKFKHALVQDVAYGTLLNQHRRNLHAQVFHEILSETEKNREPEIAAHHLTEAGLLIEAVDYWKRAGQRAAKSSANVEAVAHFSRGLELIKRLPADEPHDALKFVFQVGLTGPLIASKGYTSDELRSCISEALELSKKIKHTPEIYSILYSRWGFLLTAGFMSESLKIAQEFSELSAQQNDADALYARHRMLGGSNMCLGNLQQATLNLDQAISQYEPDRHAKLAISYGVDIRVAARCFLGETLWLMGFVDKARASVALALEDARNARHVNTTSMSLFFCGLVSFLYRDHTAVRAYMDELMSLASTQAIGAWPTLGRAMLGWTKIVAGDTDEGLAMMSEGVGAAQKLGVSMFIPFFRCRMAEVLLSADRLQESEACVAEADSLIFRSNEMNYRGEIRRLQGELGWRQSQMVEADALFSEAIAIARSQDAKVIELRAATSYADYLAARDHPERGLALLVPLLEWFEEGTASHDIRAAHAMVGRLQALNVGKVH